MSEQPRQQKLLRDELERLVMLLTECSTQLEDAAYERELQRLTREAIDDGDDTEIEAALAALKSAQPSAYDQLLTFAEESAQSIVTDAGASMLFIVPLLAWSRYRNFCGEIAASAASRVAQSFKRLMTSGKDDVVVRIGNVLIAPEHIPETLTETRTVLARLIASHEDQEGDVVDLRDLIDKPAAADFADSRYLLVAVSAKTPADIFRPATESYIDRARAMMNFCLEAHASLEFAMIGTVFEVQPPGAFFAAWRETESAMRVWSLKSLVDFIGSMGYEPQDVIASAGFFVPTNQENTDLVPELRIGISPRRNAERVVSGVAWPVSAEEMESVRELATSVLHAKGLRNIVIHEQDFPLEWCEDCGSPLYANPQGMVVHIEFGDDKDPGSFAPTLN